MGIDLGPQRGTLQPCRTFRYSGWSLDAHIVRHVTVRVQPAVGDVPHVLAVGHMGQVLHQNRALDALDSRPRIVKHTVPVTVRMPEGIINPAGLKNAIKGLVQFRDVLGEEEAPRFAPFKETVVALGVQTPDAIELVLLVPGSKSRALRIVQPVEPAQEQKLTAPVAWMVSSTYP